MVISSLSNIEIMRAKSYAVKCNFVYMSITSAVLEISTLFVNDVPGCCQCNLKIMLSGLSQFLTNSNNL